MSDDNNMVDADDDSDLLAPLPEVDALANLRDALGDDGDDDDGTTVTVRGDDADTLDADNIPSTDKTPDVSGANKKAEDDGDPLAGFSEDRKGLRALREAHRAQAKELKAKTQRLAELEAERESWAQAQANWQQQQSTVGEDFVSPEVARLAAEYKTYDMLEFLGKWQSGEYEDTKEMRKHRANVLEALELKDPREVAMMLKKARNGEFGDISRDVENIATESLAAIHANGAIKQKQLAQQQQILTVRRQAAAEVMAAIPKAFGADGKLANTPEAKEFTVAGEELAQAIPNLFQLPEAPRLVLRYQQMKQAEARNAELEKKVKELEARLARTGRSLPTGQTASPAARQPANSPSDRLRAALAGAGFDS
jgi:hypothetical protein